MDYIAYLSVRLFTSRIRFIFKLICLCNVHYKFAMNDGTLAVSICKLTKMNYLYTCRHIACVDSFMAKATD